MWLNGEGSQHICRGSSEHEGPETTGRVVLRKQEPGWQCQREAELRQHTQGLRLYPERRESKGVAQWAAGALYKRDDSSHQNILRDHFLYCPPPTLLPLKKKLNWVILGTSLYIALSTYYICIYRYGEIWIYLYPHNNQHRSNSNIRKWRGAALNTNEICIKYSF